ncbi:hypothetical protein TIFTF001_027257 [Ficus carica]|uniref:Uncharacterized protein n=1 Tax=Ficus carica TaxID=3494 RepID=A0AA88DMT1_FICCA|nr:hypothetical protein TIFTF001_027257 [Ficus carica]
MLGCAASFASGFIGANMMSFRGWFPMALRLFVTLFSSGGCTLLGFCSKQWHLVCFTACPSRHSSYSDGPLVGSTFFESL